MAKRFPLLIALTLALTLLSSCPGATSPLVGTWILTRGTNPMGLEIKANGEAESYSIPQGNGHLGGELTWEVEGTRFLIHQFTAGPDYFIYAGRITNNSSIEGNYIGWDGQFAGSNGTWSAVKVN